MPPFPRRFLLPALSVLLSAFSLSVHAADPVDFGPDLGYLRVHSLAIQREAIAEALRQPRVLVLDLRYPADERDAGETLRQLLASPPARLPLLVLVSPATPVPVVGAIASSPVRLLTLGVKDARPGPHVVVEQSAADDRRAYAALATGTALTDLISGKIEKERYDEASLVHEFKNGNPDARPPTPGKVESPAAPEAAPPERLTDRVLQRAVHLHRALLALKRG